MANAGMPSDASKTDRVETILRELDALPTLGSVAIRVLELTADETSEVRDLIDVVASDPALASRVLALCRCHERGRVTNVTTIDRAVLLLGFEAVRQAVMAVQVFEVMDELQQPSGQGSPPAQVFDREAFWLHSLGVAVASESIVTRGTLTGNIRPSEAFMAGLLHDLGQLALHVLLPESFDQVCRMAETHSASLDRACRQIIGIDTHTAGKRLAEHWGLPDPLRDVIWMNGQPLEALPHVAHRTLIAVVSLADAVVRSRYITPGAHWPRTESLSTLCIPAGITVNALDQIAGSLHEEVSRRAEALGLSLSHDKSILLRSIMRANESLARANAGMRQRERLAFQQARVFEVISEFLESITGGSALIDVVTQTARSVGRALGTQTEAALFHVPDCGEWRLVRFGPSGRPFGQRVARPSADSMPLESVVREFPGPAPAAVLVPWVAELLGEEVALEELRITCISGRDGSGVVVLVRTPLEELDDAPMFRSLNRCWQAALSAAVQRDRFAHLTEQLAEANRSMIDMQERLARNQTMATLGEVAAGAAHEMNNPLTIISGRAQLLARRVEDGQLRRMSAEIMEQAHRLSEMITALRSFAEPVAPSRREVDLADLVVRTVQRHGPRPGRQPQVNTIFPRPLPPVIVDAELVARALGELVRNAVESKGCSHIELRVQTDPLNDRLKIEVRDNGSGLSEHVLKHAFDPFFSAKPAGRQPGLGLANARRFVEAHGGRVTLANIPGGGAVATIWLDEWQKSRPATSEAA